MKSENELITVGMPVFNGEANLKEAIKSILSQSYGKIELILSDDNSTDRSIKICEEFQKKDNRITIYRHQRNIGAIANFNFVLNKAKGTYFVWAAQDDFREKEAFFELMKLFQQFPDAVLSVSHYKNIFKKNKYTVFPKEIIDNRQTKLKSVLNFLKSGNLSFFYGLHKTKILKKSGGYFTDSRPFFKSSDFLTIYKVLLNGKFVYTPKVLFYKRDTGLFTQKYRIIEDLDFQPNVLNKIFRYLFFPLFYLYDFTYGTYYLIQSDFTVYEKLQIMRELLKNFMGRNYGFLRSLLKGSFLFLKGLVRKKFYL